MCTEPAKILRTDAVAMDAGKHVIIEVPFAQTMQDCWDLIVGVERSGLVFQMAEQLRFAPFVTAWTNMVKEGKRKNRLCRRPVPPRPFSSVFLLRQGYRRANLIRTDDRQSKCPRSRAYGILSTLHILQLPRT